MSRQDIVILNLISKFGKVLGLLPSVTKDIPSKFFSCAYNLILFAFYSYLCYYYFQRTAAQRVCPSPLCFLESCQSLSEFLFALVCVASTCYNGQRARLMFELLEASEAALRKHGFRIKKKLSLFLLEFVFYNLIIIVLTITEITLSAEVSARNVRKTISLRIILYCQFIVTIFVCNMGQMLKRRYKFLNQLIQTYLISRNELTDKQIMTHFREFHWIYQTLYRIVDHFNSICKWQVFLIIVSAVLSVLNGVNVALSRSDKITSMSADMESYLSSSTICPGFYVVSRQILIRS